VTSHVVSWMNFIHCLSFFLCSSLSLVARQWVVTVHRRELVPAHPTTNSSWWAPVPAIKGFNGAQNESAPSTDHSLGSRHVLGSWQLGSRGSHRPLPLYLGFPCKFVICIKHKQAHVTAKLNYTNSEFINLVINTITNSLIFTMSH